MCYMPYEVELEGKEEEVGAAEECEDEEEQEEEQQNHAANNIPILLKLIISPSKSLASHFPTLAIHRHPKPIHEPFTAEQQHAIATSPPTPSTPWPLASRHAPRHGSLSCAISLPTSSIFTLRHQPHSPTP